MFSRFYRKFIAIGNFLQPYFLLAIRFFWGWQFLKAGVGKFEDIMGLGDYFERLGIPLPHFQAYLAAITEAVGGLFLLIGFASRLVAIPLTITMIVALLTAHREVTFMIFDDPVHVTQLAPFTFLMVALTIFVFGPGKFSADKAIHLEN